MRRTGEIWRRGGARGRGSGWVGLGVVLLGVWWPSGTLLAGSEPEPQEAQLRVSGMGWLGNRQARHLLRKPGAQAKVPPVYEPGFVEDAVVLLLAQTESQGYLQAEIRVHLGLEDGTEVTRVARRGQFLDLPRSWRSREVHFEVTRGLRYYFKAVECVGLTALPEVEARRFFIPGEALVVMRGLRAFNEERLRGGIKNLTAALRLEGYEKAEVVAEEVLVDDATGSVRVRLRVNEGVRSVLGEVESKVLGGVTNRAGPIRRDEAVRGQPYSEVWRQDYVRGLAAEQQEGGYLESEVRLELARRPVSEEEVEVSVSAEVEPGLRYRVGEVRFEGVTNTARRLLDRRTRLRPGDVLDGKEAAEGRQRLSRLGIFDSVGMRLEPTTNAVVRDVVYEVKEGKRVEVSLLAAAASYDILIGGVELNWRNVLGRAHQLRMEARQSFKTTQGDVVYSIPAHLGEEVTVFASGSYLRREEISFLRVEEGAGVGVRRYLPSITSDVGLRYAFELLNAEDTPVGVPQSEDATRSGAVILDFNHDRRDSPLNPRSGYRVGFSAEFADPSLGGVSEYQRVEVAGSVHVRLGGGRALHFGLSQGILAQAYAGGGDLPFNKRFFPGGENSIRGYSPGEASPLNALGQQIGAEVSLLGTAEFEQALTETWALVVFVDALATAVSMEDYPGDESLYSVGGGLRWKSVVGPVRLEYGYNLNPREPYDPVGTFQFSVGFPF